ncbi:MAG: hypothetical protein JWR26_4915 [Pedosphaera sp.]|nr:hypothetical protein [Pedosphaera sp.]
MSTESPTPTIAYLAQGKVRLKTDAAAPRTVDSAYGNSIREKEVRSQQKNSWKAGGGNGGPLSGPMLWGKAAVSQDVPLAVTSICGGRETGGLVYSMESGSLCALLETGPLGADERRLWNDNRTRIRHLAVSRPAGDLAFGVLHENGTANIGIKINGEGGIKELTEGDSFDTAPCWLPGEGQKIVFQSAGIGRNREGQFLALGPFCIQQLDATAGEITTLVEDRHYDYLAPKIRDDGSLFYIRRPYTQSERLHPLRMIKDFFLFPLRLAYAIFQFLNFFSTLFTGRRLTSADGTKAHQMHMRQMMIWGNLVQGQRPAKVEEEGSDLVPKSWELHRRNTAGETKMLATGVLAYDIGADGTVVYTNGNALFLIRPDGRKEHLLNENMIEQVFFVPR